MNRLKDASDSKCIALCAELDGEPVGYINVYPNAIGGAFGDRVLTQYEDCCNDDDLVLYLHKRLK